MTESPRVLQLRQELAELGDPEPGTADLAEATRASILAELSDLGAPAAPPAEAPRPIHPAVRVQVHAPAPRPLPSNPLPAAPSAAENLMPRAPETPNPRLTTLLERLKSNLAAKKYKAAGIMRMAIRRHCALHGLPVPPEAAIQADTCPRKFRKTAAPAPATAPHGSASPGRKAAKGAAAPGARRAAQPPAQGAGEVASPAPTTPLDKPYLAGHPAPAARIRALRSQALEMLPELEGLTPEQASQAHDEMDLLAKVLVLGGQLITRRTA